MYNHHMVVLRFPDGHEVVYPGQDWKPMPGDIYSDTSLDKEYEVKSVSWLYPDSCTALVEELILEE